MNIWFVSKYASPPQYAKAPSRLFYLASEAYEKGNKVWYITSDSNHFSNFPSTKEIYNDEVTYGVSIRWIKTKKYKKTASVRRILSWFDFEKKLFFMNTKQMGSPDVVIVSSLSIFSVIYGYYLKKKFKSFLVFEVRDIWPLTMTEEGGFSKWHPLVLFIGFVEKFGYKKADLVVGTMPKLDIHVKKIIGYNKPFLCSPLGFDPKDYVKDNLRWKDENFFSEFVPDNKVIVGYAGSMGITNALETFIDTIMLMHKDKNVHFLLVGSGDLKECYQEMLKGYDNVTFLPRIPQHQVKHFLSICDILYLSTKDSKVWNYGQSMNKVVEYMLSAKPIIATYTGYPSMINEADCGLFLNSSNPEDLRKAILNFSNLSKQERENIGKKGREWIYQNRTYSKLAKEYLNKISEIMSIKDTKG